MKEIKSTRKEEKRINVFLRDEGLGSRRAIDDYITKEYVTINGKVATLGSKVNYKDVVTLKSVAKDLM